MLVDSLESSWIIGSGMIHRIQKRAKRIHMIEADPRESIESCRIHRIRFFLRANFCLLIHFSSSDILISIFRRTNQTKEQIKIVERANFVMFQQGISRKKSIFIRKSIDRLNLTCPISFWNLLPSFRIVYEYLKTFTWTFIMLPVTKSNTLSLIFFFF